MMSEDQLTGFEIAVIGMTGRFPGAQNLSEFWENLKNGVESISFFTDEELKLAEVSPEWTEHPNYVNSKGGEFEDKKFFDATFFGYTPKEAEIMDPQVRIFHECAWEALENAGYAPSTYAGPIGLFAGASSSSYWEALGFFSGNMDHLGNMAAQPLNNKDFMCARIAHKLNLKGPVFSMQTACSTSLVAVHLASQALLNGECDMALAGGVTIYPQPAKGYVFQEGMILSPDGHCRAFDAKAKGTVGGNGVGIAVLKRLEDAWRDRDCIHAIIKGSAINNDGTRKVGFTAPSVEGQAEAIKMACQVAQVDPDSVGYIEAHGTGTVLGDPVEIEGLKLAFNSNKKGGCAVGSVKTNIGHLDSAAGIAGFIKAVLTLKNRLIPPSLHFETPNPKIDFDNSPFYVNNKLTEWKRETTPLRAGVSSMGIGGTNAHVVLEEWPTLPSEGYEDRRIHHLLLLSAKTRTALDKAAENLEEHLKANPGINLADTAYTLQVGRQPFQYRRTCLCSSVDEAVAQLSAPDSAKVKTSQVSSEERQVIFMFPGLGSQYVNMGLDLYRTEPIFRKEMDRCFEILGSLTNENIKEILYPPGDSSTKVAESSERINRFDIAQFVIFIFEYSLARLMITWGIKPRAMIGYSFGEYSAACISGVFTLEEALKLIAARGKLIDKTPAGAMLSVPLIQEDLQPLLPGECSIAIDNGPSCVVSGPQDTLIAFEEQLKQKRIMCVRLPAAHALHSKMMTPVLSEFEHAVESFNLKEPEIPFISNVNGHWISVDDAVDPAYWGRHLSHTVKFADGIKALLEESDSVFIEVGPGQDLSVLCRHHVKNDTERVIINLTKHPRETVTDDRYLLNKLGRLWLAGAPLDWREYHAGEKRYRVPLPTYPFERLSYWLENDVLTKDANVSNKKSLAKKTDIIDWFYIPSWKYSPLPVTAAHSISIETPQLVFMDETGLGDSLTKELKSGETTVIIVKAGMSFSKKSDVEYTIKPGEADDYSTLLHMLEKTGTTPGRIIHLWSVTGDKKNTGDVENYSDEMQELGFYSLMYLAQAVGKQNYKHSIKIDVISDNMQAVTGEDVISPEKATLLGAVKVIPQEYHNIDCRSIDISTPRDEEPPHRWKETVNQLLTELSTESPDIGIAYRNRSRWVRIFDPIRLEKSGAEIPSRLKNEGVYLVTGGLGGIGYTIAEYLSKTVRARLVLTGRSALPPREEWAKWIADQHVDDKTRQKITRVIALEEAGAEVLLCPADVSDYRQMKETVNAAEKRFGRIDGVIHSAGIPDGAVIHFRTKDTTDKIFAPKVNGTRVLDDILKHTKLDFFVICSSLSSVTGGLGQLGYCAANAFQDAYAHHRLSEKHDFTASINWSSWKEVGFGVESLKKLVEDKEIPESEVEARLKHSISPAEGIEIFKRVMDYSLPQIIISTTELSYTIESIDRQSAPDEEEPEEKAQPGKLYPRPDLSSEYVIPTTEFEIACAEILKQYFGFEKVGIHDNLFDFGVTSLTMLHINERLNRELKKEIPLVVMFDFPTIHSLENYLLKEEKKTSAEDSSSLEEETNLLYDSLDAFQDED